MVFKLLAGLAGSLLIAGAAYAKRSLSGSGMAAAVVLGTVLYAFGGVKWYGLLLAFFISSSILSHRKKQEKKQVEDLFAKGGRRDWLQVAANGGIGLLAVIGKTITGTEDMWYAFYIGTIAAVTSDTWATEIGVLSVRNPRHILTWKIVEPGTSGGVSWLGTAAVLAGGAFIGLCAMLFEWMDSGRMDVLPIISGVIGGLVGSMADSVLGATFQTMYHCRVCGKETERAYHHGQQTERIKGYSWCTNDVVNVTAAIAGGLAGWVIAT
ncbi:DUF92 domain-containing protein [Aneurinibacillus terranovensis]|uniref:DUF92 domain-containing protein n=1 Tax=Aneurinibacillus terranovensis TaxID=278991 RepID=UPI000418F337|nr:DUF92 domain-containing protein [Aneurinibacillus terranovensis]